jgi:hypothetical protein
MAAECVLFAALDKPLSHIPGYTPRQTSIYFPSFLSRVHSTSPSR